MKTKQPSQSAKQYICTRARGRSRASRSSAYLRRVNVFIVGHPENVEMRLTGGDHRVGAPNLLRLIDNFADVGAHESVRRNALDCVDTVSFIGSLHRESKLTES